MTGLQRHESVLVGTQTPAAGQGQLGAHLLSRGAFGSFLRERTVLSRARGPGICQCDAAAGRPGREDGCPGRPQPEAGFGGQELGLCRADPGRERKPQGPPLAGGGEALSNNCLKIERAGSRGKESPATGREHMGAGSLLSREGPQASVSRLGKWS